MEFQAQKILCLITDKNWLTDAYATDTCVEERSQNLLDAMLNTPDKIENNTPLHYACKFANDGIVETLLRYKDCNREPINRYCPCSHSLYRYVTFNNTIKVMVSTPMIWLELLQRETNRSWKMLATEFNAPSEKSLLINCNTFHSHHYQCRLMLTKIPNIDFIFAILSHLCNKGKLK
jgi:ankyrin repeat protein